MKTEDAKVAARPKARAASIPGRKQKVPRTPAFLGPGGDEKPCKVTVGDGLDTFIGTPPYAF